MKKIIALVLCLLVFLTACQQKQSSEEVQGKEENQEVKKIVIGVSPVPHEEIIEHFKDELQKRGVEVEVKVFDDYVLPNKALAEGELDANFFQHKPYLDQFSKDNNLELEVLGAVHVEPMGLYSTKVSKAEDLPEGAEIAIPNDATNGGRALILLDKNGIIKLKDNTDLAATEKDIVDNPKNLKFIPLEAPTLPKAYQDVDAAVINSNFALQAGLNPQKDSLLAEDKDSPYANIIAVRKGEKDQERFKILLEVLNSGECKQFINDKYEGSIFPAFQ